MYKLRLMAEGEITIRKFCNAEGANRHVVNLSGKRTSAGRNSGEHSQAMESME